eukprot:scaffold536578_cov37-Prasinocladus_malaysianus.AAC.1
MVRPNGRPKEHMFGSAGPTWITSHHRCYRVVQKGLDRSTLSTSGTNQQWTTHDCWRRADHVNFTT